MPADEDDRQSPRNDDQLYEWPRPGEAGSPELPRPRRRWPLYLLAAVVAVAGAAAAVSVRVKVETLVSARGQVQAAEPGESLRAAEGGVVRSIAVNNGDAVTEGQVLMTFEAPPGPRPVAGDDEREAALAIRAAGLRALIGGGEPDYGEAAQRHPDLVRDNRGLLDATRASQARQAASLKTRAEQQARSVALYAKQIETLEAEQKGLAEALTQRRRLFKQGRGSRADVTNAQLELSKIEAAIAEAANARDRAGLAAEEARHRIAEAKAAETARALDDLKAVDAQLAELRGPAEAAAPMPPPSVLAPKAGVVRELRVFAPGDVLAPGATVLTLEPAGAALVVRARFRTSDAPRLVAGQPARVSLIGPGRRPEGLMMATLERLAPEMRLDSRGRVYLAGTITFDTRSIEIGGQARELAPGMAVTVQVVSGEQSLFRSLLDRWQRRYARWMARLKS
jgi:adhesin transport system membrane fusion protein